MRIRHQRLKQRWDRVVIHVGDYYEDLTVKCLKKRHDWSETEEEKVVVIMLLPRVNASSINWQKIHLQLVYL